MGLAHAELRVYLQIHDLQPQFAAYMATPLRARGYPPFAGEDSLIVEVAPALAIHRVADLALKAAPDLEPGILFTERQFGLLELHADDPDMIQRAGKAILEGPWRKTGRSADPKNSVRRHCREPRGPACHHFEPHARSLDGPPRPIAAAL